MELLGLGLPFSSAELLGMPDNQMLLFQACKLFQVSEELLNWNNSVGSVRSQEPKITLRSQYMQLELQTVELLGLGIPFSSAELLGVPDNQMPD